MDLANDGCRRKHEHTGLIRDEKSDEERASDHVYSNEYKILESSLDIQGRKSIDV